MPDHFLHVTVDATRELGLDAAARAWTAVAPFPIAYRRVNCFHDAVIVEADANGLQDLAQPESASSFFLPHLSIGYVRRREAPDRLRKALRRVRDVELGVGVVDEVLLCEVPASRSTLFRPWRVVGAVKLGG